MILFESLIFNKDLNIGLLQIPKNASTSARILKDYKGESWKQTSAAEVDSSAKIVIVLRDPESRFKSAINMYFATQGNLFTMPTVFNNYLETDQHFLPQTKFIGTILDKFSDIDYWQYNHSVLEDINDHYKLDITEILKARCNTSEKIVTSINKTFIKKHYADDIAIMNSVKFLNNEKNKK